MGRERVGVGITTLPGVHAWPHIRNLSYLGLSDLLPSILRGSLTLPGFEVPALSILSPFTPFTIRRWYLKDGKCALTGLLTDAQALVTMGVLVPGGDPTSLKRTASFFLNSFSDRLNQQKQQREVLGVKYDESYKQKQSKEEAKERRKAILVRPVFCIRPSPEQNVLDLPHFLDHQILLAPHQLVTPAALHVPRSSSLRLPGRC